MAQTHSINPNDIGGADIHEHKRWIRRAASAAFAAVMRKSVRTLSVFTAVMCLVLGLGVGTANAVSAPFTWGSPTSESWCPSFHGYSGCDNTQSPTEFTTSFAPSQVSISGSTVDLKMNSTLTTSGAFNTSDTPSPLETFTAPYTISEELFLPCTTGRIDNWPAFWLAEQSGGGSQYAEADVAEGAKGSLYGTIWYGTASTDKVEKEYPNSCGGSTGTGADVTYKVHTYTNSNGALETDLFWNGTEEIGASSDCATSACSTTPALANDVMFVVNDYAGGSESDPAVGNTTMKVLNFSYAKD